MGCCRRFLAAASLMTSNSARQLTTSIKQTHGIRSQQAKYACALNAFPTEQYRTWLQFLELFLGQSNPLNCVSWPWMQSSAVIVGGLGQRGNCKGNCFPQFHIRVLAWQALVAPSAGRPGSAWDRRCHRSNLLRNSFGKQFAYTALTKN